MNIVLVLEDVWKTSSEAVGAFIAGLPPKDALIFLDKAPLLPPGGIAPTAVLVIAGGWASFDGIGNTLFPEGDTIAGSTPRGAILSVQDFSNMEVLMLVERIRRAAFDADVVLPFLGFIIRKDQFRLHSDFQSIAARRAGPLEADGPAELVALIDRVMSSRRLRRVRWFRRIFGRILPIRPHG